MLILELLNMPPTLARKWLMGCFVFVYPCVLRDDRKVNVVSFLSTGAKGSYSPAIFLVWFSLFYLTSEGWGGVRTCKFPARITLPSEFYGVILPVLPTPRRLGWGPHLHLSCPHNPPQRFRGLGFWPLTCGLATPRLSGTIAY